MFPAPLIASAHQLIECCRNRQLRLATAESCTGGLISAILTSVPGSSDVFECGFVTYSNAAKTRMISVPAELISRHGAVSAEVALAMAQGAVRHSGCDLAVAVTGVAGPGGGSELKPVGLVHCAAYRPGQTPLELRLLLGRAERDSIRLMAAGTALDMAAQLAAGPWP